MPINTFCDQLVKSPRYNNRLVILCEGTKNIELYTPQQFSRLEQLPDADFYNQCIPRWWRDRIPYFIPCGGRSDVLKVLNTLITRNETGYINKDKLFALVDWDFQNMPLQVNTTGDDPIKAVDTDQLYDSLYKNKNKNLNHKQISQYKIILTNVRHKEAFFFDPGLASLYEDFIKLCDIKLKGQQLLLNNVYNCMIATIEHDKELINLKDRCWQRVNMFIATNLITHDMSYLCNLLRKTLNSQQNRTTISAILSLAKAKHCWENMMFEDKIFRPQLLSAIARFYSHNCSEKSTSKYLLCQLLQALYPLR